jgi:hypothetical protein
MELVLVAGSPQWVYGADAIKQAIHLRLAAVAGEWFLDEGVGSDLLARVLGQKYDEAAAREAIMAVLQGTPGVSRVTSLVLTWTAATRVLAASWSIDTDYGPLDGDQQVTA